MYNLVVEYHTINGNKYFEETLEINEDNYLDVIWNYINKTRDKRLGKQKELGYKNNKPQQGLYLGITNVNTPVTLWRPINGTFNG